VLPHVSESGSTSSVGGVGMEESDSEEAAMKAIQLLFMNRQQMQNQHFQSFQLHGEALIKKQVMKWIAVTMMTSHSGTGI